MISAPTVSTNHPDRELCAEEALSDAIHAAMTAAKQAGWRELEIARGVLNLACAWLSAEEEMAATEAAIAHGRAEASVRFRSPRR
jgi:hypothetical protein